MKKIVLLNGLIAGLIVTVMMWLNVSFGQNSDYAEAFGYATMVIAFSLIYFAIKFYRDKKSNGEITFGQAFKIGLYITLIATTCYTVSWMIMSETIAKDFMSQYYEKAVTDLKQSDLTQEEIEVKLGEMDRYLAMYENPFFKVVITITEIFPVGLLVSLISAFLLRKSAGDPSA